MANPPEPGLCRDCRHGRAVRSARGSVFWRCGLSEREPGFAKYPRLPVVHCSGHAPEDPDQEPA